MTAENVGENLIQFFNNGNGIRKDVVDLVVQQAEAITNWIKDFVGVRFTSSSLLVIYDADPSNSQPLLKMIDFAHTYEEAGFKNDDYHFGMTHLISTLRTANK